MIPDAAVQAAMEAFLLESIKREGELSEKPFALLAALEAAAPHMRQAFYLEMNLRAVHDELNTPLQLSRATHGND